MTTTREDWPFGPALRAARERFGVSARKAALSTNGLISSGRWYQLESGVQKVKGREVPIGTTPETVIAAAMAVSWPVDEALAVAEMTATEAEVRAVENKMTVKHREEIVSSAEEPRWLLYLEALLFYAAHHKDDPDFAYWLIESEDLATRAMETQPKLTVGLDETIRYGGKLNELLVRLRDYQRNVVYGNNRASRPSGASDKGAEGNEVGGSPDDGESGSTADFDAATTGAAVAELEVDGGVDHREQA